MATISLRAYYSEIEGITKHGRTKDAIIHCRQILKSYPKSIDTYRLLGKAYLEAQRFTEGADVLQRVLSAVPDDFVSQIGLSIIREDEGNLDAALWHMERAFEAQPSNKAVQDELRRLYGRRDGVQPTKIRLTRGALVRMYARGDLYQQAIAEGRMALVEQPDRVDIELILARMYYLSNQKISATEICSRILAKLPFCYEANKILTEILPGTARQDEVEIYKRRLFDLDPYLEFAPPGAFSSAEAPEESIMIEPLELDEARLAAEQSELAEEEAELPDWLAALETREAPSDELTQIMDKGIKVSGFTEGKVETVQPAESVRSEETEIPDWMKEAGWQPAEEGKEEAESITEEVAEEIAGESEIPEWLQSIAPTEEAPGIFGTAESTSEEEDTAWLESILEGEIPSDQVLDEGELEAPVEQPPAPEEILEPEISAPPTEEIHPIEALVEEFASQETEPEPVDLENVADLLSSEEAKGNVPEWLAGMAAMESVPEKAEPVEEITPDNEWLKSLAAEAEGHTGVEPEEEISQALELEPEQPEEVEKEGAEEIKIDTDWLKRLPFEEEAPSEVEPALEETVQPFEVEPEQEEEVEKAGAEEIKIDTDWLKKISPEEEGSEEVEPTLEAETLPAEFEAELPEEEKEGAGEFKITTDWLKSLPEDKVEEEQPAEAEVPTDEVESVEFEAEEKPEVEEFAADADFLKRLAQEAESEAETEPEGVAGQTEVEPELSEEGKEAIEEFAPDTDWLKRLSIGEEASIVTEPEGIEEKPLGEEPALEQAVEPGEEPEIPEEVQVEEISLEEAAPAQSMTAEEFLSEIEEAIPPEKEATQPTHITPPPVGGVPIEEFIAQLEAEEELPSEEEEPLEGTPASEEKLPSEQIELTAAELDEILPVVVADNNFDQSAGTEVPDWLKESLEIEGVEPQPGAAEEAPSLEGIPGIFPEKTPEELALEEILAAPEEVPQEEVIPTEEVLEVPEWAETKEIEEIEAITEIEAVKETPEEQIEVVPPAEMEVTEEEADKLEAAEGRELLGWLAEDFEETEQELTEEAGFVPPAKEESEWVKEEALIEPEEAAEFVDAEGVPEEAAEEIEQEEVPDWLRAMADEKELQPEVVEPKEEAIPEWLKDLEEEPELEVQTTQEPVETQPEELVVEEAEAVPEASFEVEETLAEPSVEETSPMQVAELPVERMTPISEGSELYNAQAAMTAHDLETALTYYNSLIGRGEALEDTIHDLREALYHYPVDISIWQALGDAYMRSNQLQDALDAYTKAEELMR